MTTLPNNRLPTIRAIVLSHFDRLWRGIGRRKRPSEQKVMVAIKEKSCSKPKQKKSGQTGSFYDVPGFLNGKSSWTRIELDQLGDVRGKCVLHLQCHFGLDTLSLARLGASVTGVDFSSVAIENARALNDRLGLDARFIQCDVNQLDQFLKGEFDIVYASFGVIGWHSDLGKWARIVSRFLKNEGRLCFAEFHPALWMLSDDHSKIAYSYFQSDAIIGENEKSYANPDATSLGTSYCWNHSLGEFFQALES